MANKKIKIEKKIVYEGANSKFKLRRLEQKESELIEKLKSFVKGNFKIDIP